MELQHTRATTSEPLLLDQKLETGEREREGEGSVIYYTFKIMVSAWMVAGVHVTAAMKIIFSIIIVERV